MAVAVTVGALYLGWSLTGIANSGSSSIASPTGSALATTVRASSSATAEPSTTGDSTGDDGTVDQGAGEADGATVGPAPTITLGIQGDDGDSSASSGFVADEVLPYSGAMVPALPKLKEWNAEAGELRQVGVYLHRTGENPVARFIAYDRMIITSLSAIGSRTQLSLWDMDAWRTVTVRAIDPQTDIAVLEVDEWSPALADLAASVTGHTWPLRPRQTVSTRAVTKANSGEGGPADTTTVEETSGIVLDLDARVIHQGGHALYDVASTTLDFNPYMAGGRLFDRNGRTVAMIVNADSCCISALPIETVLATADLLWTTNSADQTWIGLAATSRDAGVMVVGVDPDGPSADLVSYGDILETWNGEPIVDTDHLTHLLRETSVGDAVVLGVARRGRPLEFDVALSATGG